MTACYDNPSDSLAASHLPLHKGGIKEVEAYGEPPLFAQGRHKGSGDLRRPLTLLGEACEVR